MCVPVVLFESGSPTLLEQTAATVVTLVYEAQGSWFSIAHEASLQLPKNCRLNIIMSLVLEILYTEQLSI